MRNCLLTADCRGWSFDRCVAEAYPVVFVVYFASFFFMCDWIEWDGECCADMRAVMRLVKSVFNKMDICDFHLV